MTHPLTVVLPVYKDLASVSRCMESLIDSYSDANFRVIIIDDCSPDDEIRFLLKDVSENYSFIELITNKMNLGFVASANKGILAAGRDDVVLLNSDVIVPLQWVERLIDIATRDESIATITTFSNNATIASFPDFCEENSLLFDLDVTVIDDVFRKIPDTLVADVPTAVGSCMFIRRACIDKIGLFDIEAFEKGYGEENDFSMRACNAGWRNVLAPNLFVYHKGGVSFGDEKATLVDRGVRKVEDKHPGYLRQVHEYLQADPSAAIRVYSILSLLRNDKLPKILHVSHALGGGVRYHVQELAHNIRKCARSLSAEPIGNGGISLKFFQEYRTLKDHLFFDLKLDFDKLVILCRYIGLDLVHFHHIKGLPAKLWLLPTNLGIPYDVTLHDYYYINASPTQTNEDGDFTENISEVVTELPSNTSVEEWRERQKIFLSGARKVIAPTHAVVDIYRRYFPNINYCVSYHPDYINDYPYSVRVAPVLQGRFRVGVIGAISKEKGAIVLEEVARMAKKDKLAIDFILIGYAFRPLRGITDKTGPYRSEDVDRLVAENLLNLIWFPALWPETYSYTLSVALRAGLPILAPAMGAFVERLRDRPVTWLSDSSDSGQIFTLVKEIRNFLLLVGDARYNWPQKEIDNIYLGCYTKELRMRSVANNKLDALDLLRIIDNLKKKEHRKGRAMATLLLLLIRAREFPLLRDISSWIPMTLQRKIKRALSSSAIHDVVTSIKEK
jgi:GT2 family glycosyltransferase/glycosyltransferase involved in cell wall biosynthesis